VFDIVITIKSIFLRQNIASSSYDPRKPGRPFRVYHKYWFAILSLCLDVEVHPGNASSAGHGFAGLWDLIVRLPVHPRPTWCEATVRTGGSACGAKPRNGDSATRARCYARVFKSSFGLARSRHHKGVDRRQQGLVKGVRRSMLASTTACNDPANTTRQ